MKKENIFFHQILYGTRENQEKGVQDLPLNSTKLLNHREV